MSWCCQNEPTADLGSSTCHTDQPQPLLQEPLSPVSADLSGAACSSAAPDLIGAGLRQGVEAMKKTSHLSHPHVRFLKGFLFWGQRLPRLVLSICCAFPAALVCMTCPDIQTALDSMALCPCKGPNLRGRLSSQRLSWYELCPVSCCSLGEIPSLVVIIVVESNDCAAAGMTRGILQLWAFCSLPSPLEAPPQNQPDRSGLAHGQLAAQNTSFIDRLEALLSRPLSHRITQNSEGPKRGRKNSEPQWGPPFGLPPHSWKPI